MKNKVVHVNNVIRPGGGPAGYLYNLSEAIGDGSILEILATENLHKIRTSDYEKVQKSQNSLKYLARKTLNLLPNIIKWRLCKFRSSKFWKKKIDKNIVKILNEYKVIVFHNHSLAYTYIKKHKVKNQNIYFMPHAPTETSTEFLVGLEGYYGNCPEKSKIDFLKFFGNFEKELYQNVDGLICPASSCLDAYFNWDNNFNANEYIKFTPLTGVNKLKPTKSKNEILNSFNIDSNKIVIGFIGRYHPHKGFDRFLKIAKEFNDSRYHFISAGNGPIEPFPNTENYTNLGWQTDISNLIEMTDIIIIPNRYAYFDLLLLEAISLGKTIITRNIGGHKKLISMSIGIVGYEDENEINDLIIGLDLLKNKAENLRIFDNKFNQSQFLKEHVLIAQNMLSSLKE